MLQSEHSCISSVAGPFSATKKKKQTQSLFLFPESIMQPFTFCEAHSPRKSTAKISPGCWKPPVAKPWCGGAQAGAPVAPGPAQGQGLTHGQGHTVLCPFTPELWGGPVPKMVYLAILKWIIQQCQCLSKWTMSDALQCFNNRNAVPHAMYAILLLLQVDKWNYE